MMAKISVKEVICILYINFNTKSKNGLQDSEVEWNFQKYLINENGELKSSFSKNVLPTDAEIVNWIEGK